MTTIRQINTFFLFEMTMAKVPNETSLPDMVALSLSSSASISPSHSDIDGKSEIIVKNGVVKALEISERPDDPAGDDYPESSCAPSMLEHLARLAKSEL